jgi:hypothetical protein
LQQLATLGQRVKVFGRLQQDTTAKRGIKARSLKAGWSHYYLLHILTG